VKNQYLRVVIVVCLSWVLIGCGVSGQADALAPAAPSVSTVAASPTDTPAPVATVTAVATAVADVVTPEIDAGEAITESLSPLHLPLITSNQAGEPLPTPPAEIPVYGYRIIETYPHDPNAFTQGLIFADGVLYEGTGLNGRSSLRRVDLESGEIQQIVRLPDQYFGEGITIWNESIIQLTWRSQIGFVYDLESFELLGSFTYETEGWGLTHDETHLIMSDGSNVLYYLDPDTFDVVDQLPVFAGDKLVTQLNELEYIDGFIYANIWHSDRIARIDPESGQVTAWLDLSGLFPPAERPDPQAVLNGIAYDAEGDRLLVTGKLWPSLFWIELVDD
jgi:glutaminyl-peptide cyclotransferase